MHIVSLYRYYKNRAAFMRPTNKKKKKKKNRYYKNGIAKCVKEITRGNVMCRYLTTNELICDQMNIRAIICQMISAFYMLIYFALT